MLRRLHAVLTIGLAIALSGVLMAQQDRPVLTFGGNSI